MIFQPQAFNDPAAPLDQDQRHALLMMLEGENVFLTGEAGSGKTFVIDAFREMRKGKIAVLAPTGIAALNIAGSTIHSFFHFPPRFLLPDETPDMSPEFQRTIAATDIIVIDEISMCRADLFNAMDHVCRAVAPIHRRDEAFGGKQVICVGDFHQLPPVVASGQDYELLLAHHGGIFAFETDAWHRAGFIPIHLRTSHRQGGDPEFLHALRALRMPPGCGPDDLARAVDWINRRITISPPPKDAVALCVTNAQADDVNALGESNIPGPSYRFEASVGGCFPEDIWPTSYFLDLKIGSRVMLLANDWSWIEGGYHVNGDLGHVRGIDFDDGSVEIALDDGRCGRVYRHEWLKSVYNVEYSPITGRDEVIEKVIGSFTQLPLRLAHAVTVHKSQGLSLDRVHLVLGHRGPFAGGQLYTALSRCRSLRGLSLDRPLRVDDVLVDPRVHAFQASITASMPVPAAEKRTPVPALI